MHILELYYDQEGQAAVRLIDQLDKSTQLLKR